jgi:trans-aconitate 2-methyltransferase
MQKADNSVTEFYNEFATRQIRTGVNLRHRTILHLLKKAGLKKHHRLLELGCGTGMLTGLLASYLKKGDILGVDISNESIDHARSVHSKRKNMRFMTSDLMELELTEVFDYIVLPDVLEHIPEEAHPGLFRIIRKLAHDETIVFIHIPSPAYQDYLKEFDPGQLQIIDLPVKASSIVENAESAGFYLIRFEEYPLYIKENDYRQIVFRVAGKRSSASHFPYLTMVWKEIRSRYIHPLSRK